MPYAQLSSISSRVEDIVSADAIAVGFVKSEEDGYELVGAIDAIASIEKFFDVDLIDEISFFQPAGKPGEILEIEYLLSVLEIRARNHIALLQLAWVENFVARKSMSQICLQLKAKIFVRMQSPLY